MSDLKETVRDTEADMKEALAQGRRRGVARRQGRQRRRPPRATRSRTPATSFMRKPTRCRATRRTSRVAPTRRHAALTAQRTHRPPRASRPRRPFHVRRRSWRCGSPSGPLHTRTAEPFASGRNGSLRLSPRCDMGTPGVPARQVSRGLRPAPGAPDAASSTVAPSAEAAERRRSRWRSARTPAPGPATNGASRDSPPHHGHSSSDASDQRPQVEQGLASQVVHDGQRSQLEVDLHAAARAPGIAVTAPELLDERPDPPIARGDLRPRKRVDARDSGSSRGVDTRIQPAAM